MINNDHAGEINMSWQQQNKMKTKIKLGGGEMTQKKVYEKALKNYVSALAPFFTIKFPFLFTLR
jgi:hypothetical protein